MKKYLSTLASLVLIFYFEINAQTTHDVAISGFTFSPSQLTINVGDIVRWTNNGGFHNVVADDNSFTSGAPSTSIWVYEHTFNSTGTNPYYCSPHGGVGGVGMSGVITVQSATGITNNNITVEEFRLFQNYPNPFNPTTKISWQSPVSGRQILKVYDVLGNVVANLIDEFKPAGSYETNFDASKLTSGVYFYRLQVGQYISTKKMIVIK
jgi:plastocyanin